jgi:anion-transporting  ArsA/GET3 family ATPase
MNALLDLKLVFVTGKGGVGKTTVASALALFASQRGKKVLICEVDAGATWPASTRPHPPASIEKEILPGLFAMTMDTEASLREYLKLQLRIPVVGRIGPLAKAFDFVATAAPGVREILTVGKPVYEVRERNYDLVVVDAPASGHIIGLLAAPQAINNLVKVGLIRSQTDWLLEILSDPQVTGLVAVCTPEEMPVNETVELAARVQGGDHGPAVGGGGQPGPARALRAPGGEGVRRPGRSPALGAAGRAGGGRRWPRAGGGPPGRHHAPHPFHPSRPAPARAASTSRCPCSTCPICSPVRTDCGRPGRWPRPWARSWATDGRTGSPAPPTGDGQGAAVGQRPRPGGSIDGLLATKEIVIACGPGGVGKTTTAAAAAVMAVAIRHGSKVLVLTVDPAKRLADALGLDGIGNTEHRVPDEACSGRRDQAEGPVVGGHARHQGVVGRPDPPARTGQADPDEILANPLYQNISGRFVQSHDYIAMERLYEIHSESDYDLIVVDTPPTRNALDFLDAPNGWPTSSPPGSCVG